MTETIWTTLTPGFIYSDWDASDNVELLDRTGMAAAPDRLSLSVRTWVVQMHGQTILIDTGIGNGKSRPFRPLCDHLDNPFLERLAAIGVGPDQVDHVLLTHPHVDHVGWNTRLPEGRWMPTFPNAKYVFIAG
ncbi:MBL fold metallo-hydrolase [Caballeronia glathei]|uniref:MBL fold metallo-hydrolase n=1 Tax=Caballeronia glathei TaxID=60547 RepID=UPI000A459F21|nr:MBL fold metallo-hydrolase [Caballeronia glathei]